MKFDEDDKIREIINVVLGETRYKIYRLKIDPPRGNAWIRLRIDADFPITIRDCEIVNRRIRSFLDLEGLSEIYSLEVSSPGAEREIIIPSEVERFSGKYVKIRYLGDNNKVCEVIGKLSGIVENRIRISVDVKKNKSDIYIDIKKLIKANLYLKV